MQSSASLDRYIQQVRAIPRLSREDEHELALRAREGDQDATDRLVEANLRYVIAIGLQYRRYGVTLGDLIAEGSVGLVTAVRKFDPHRGTRFVTYAGYWIRAFVLEAVVRSSTMVGAGSGPFRSKLFFRLRRERARLSNVIADPEELIAKLAADFDTTSEKMTELLRRLDQREISLDAPAYHDSDATLVEMLPGATEPQDLVVARQRRQSGIELRLEGALSVLDDRERLIVEKRILSDDAASLASLGRELGVSRERARQLEARAKKKLAEELKDLAPAA
ncbi:MAG: sigma-70 family RNA polymerase sigma factor [Deltaproteobacteria bacterium]|jgi:RNA polymerase sigma-32 factor|nr:sigma-70 family RNA polymerase sigma factor [Deltaproteobacteria bacterium]MBW1903844.1 sigma-70 family RNA polymerase sigma factor [Deltaproteobacteria bacterium]MBW2158717.1 sigma-70 family RNA polymerase sigma factor [Deltaproteobacteria bacterium]MBW2374425.1 sigma-70 family RNA polymerase sigma factor [Deltaproteobacteria bacterium]MBW2585589.1 sigma-70 family RNA polymerase sigma factor [Deltaproteobacteria bacterium]